MKYLILFDIDGTILKMKNGISTLLFKELLEKIFKTDIPNNLMPDFAGMTDLKIIREVHHRLKIESDFDALAFSKIWSDLISDFSKMCNSEYIDLLPGVPELIELFYKDCMFELGLVTGNFKENAYQKLSVFNLNGYFNHGAFGCDNEERNFLPPLAIQRANQFLNDEVFDCKSTIIIGDSPKDIECAHHNSIPVLAVATGNFTFKQLKVLNPDYLFQNFFDAELVYTTVKNHFLYNSEISK